METNWKEGISRQVKQAVKNHAINPKLVNAINEELKEDRRFDLVYSNARGQYFGIRYHKQNVIKRKFAGVDKVRLLKLVKAKISGAKEELIYRSKNGLLT